MNYKKSLILVITLTIFSYVNAQLEAFQIDGEGWAKGDFVEIGINSRGVFGAQTDNKPSSFHLNRENDGNNIFGFIANPLRDGWVDYDGDFFTPGDPEEGFGIEVDGINFNNNNSLGHFDISGSIKGVNVISSDCFDDVAQISWEGNVSGVNIKRYYSVTLDGLFIQMTTVLKNQSPTTKSNVFFMHNVDPDNNIVLSGFYETNMELISQASSATDDICLVKASQDALLTPLDMDGSHVSLYTKNENARVCYGGFHNRDASAIWNGTGLVNTEGSSTSFIDEAISIAFNIGDLDPNETVTFTYYYILEDVDETFIPFIVNVFEENPTLCNGSDGKIVLSGLTEGETYTISYVDDGVPITNQDYVADTNGNVVIENLNSGFYSNLSISFSGCATSINTIFELTDPESPNYIISKQDFTNCDAFDGSLTFSNLTPSTEYICQFTLDGELIGPNTYVANASGNIIISNLGGGVYTNFILEQYSCVTPSNEIIEISGPLNPISYSIPDQFYCDADYDYITSIELNLLNSFIIGPDLDSDFDISYHETEDDVLNNISISDTNYLTPGMSFFTIYAKKTERINGCYSYISFNLTINLPPDFELEDAILCVNNDDSTNFDYELPILSTGLSNLLHDFQWFFEGNRIIGGLNSDLTVSEYGNYSVTAIVRSTGCNITKDVTVIPSGPPEILEVNIISLPFSENHTVQIDASGHGNYLYKIDNGPYVTSNVFSNISPGYHVFSVLDSNGCGEVFVEKILIDYMKVFTPNSDRVKDYWQIIGIDELIDAQVIIFDRYGKILKTFNGHSIGWDGTYNNINMPSTDYWFKITFKDADKISREFISHFTLKR